MKSVKQSTINGAKWGAVEKFSVQGARFLLGIIMARLLSPDDYGVISMITIFIVISETFVDSGFSLALVRQKSSSDKDFSTVFYFNVLLSMVCYGALFVVAPFVADFFHAPIIASVLRLQSLTIIINSLMAVHVAKLTIDLDFKAISLRSLLSSILSGIIGVCLAYLGFGVWALVGQTIAASVINLVFILLYCKWIPKLQFSKESFNRLFGFGRNMLLVNIINRIYMNLTSIVIGKFFNSKALGYYDRGVSLATFPVDNVNGILGKITLPILAKIQDDDERLIGVYRKYISMVSFLVFFGCCLLASQARPLVLLLFTEKWEQAIIYLQIFSFSIMFDHISTINLTLLQVKGRSDLFLKLELFKKTISITILFSAIPFGVIGICISKVIYTQIATLINTYYTGKFFRLGYLKQIKDFGPYFLCSIIACVPSYLISLVALSNFISLFIGSISAMVIYYVLMRRTEAFIEFKSLIINTIKHEI